MSASAPSADELGVAERYLWLAMVAVIGIVGIKFDKAKGVAKNPLISFMFVASLGALLYLQDAGLAIREETSTTGAPSKDQVQRNQPKVRTAATRPSNTKGAMNTGKAATTLTAATIVKPSEARIAQLDRTKVRTAAARPGNTKGAMNAGKAATTPTAATAKPSEAASLSHSATHRLSFQQSLLECRAAGKSYKPEAAIVSQPQENRHNNCRGKALLQRQTGMFLGLHAFPYDTTHSKILTVLVFDCAADSKQPRVRKNGADSRMGSVHNVSLFARAVGPAIVTPLMHTEEYDGHRVWQLDFMLHERGPYNVEVKARWLWSHNRHIFDRGKDDRAIFLGGSERRRCDYCQTPRLIPVCEKMSHVQGSPARVLSKAIKTAADASKIMLTAAVTTQWLAANKHREPGRWVAFDSNDSGKQPFGSLALAQSFTDKGGRFDSLRPGIGARTAPAASGVPVSVGPWFYAEARRRYRLYAGDAIFGCLRRQFAGGSNGSFAIAMLGDSQVRNLWGPVANFAGASQVTAAYLRELKERLRLASKKSTTLTVNPPVAMAEEATPLRVQYLQEWHEKGAKWWDYHARRIGLFEGKVSVFLYNCGAAHKAFSEKPSCSELFLKWWDRRSSAKEAKPPTKLFYLSMVRLQGQRNAGWDEARFRARDLLWASAFEQKGWVTLDAYGPTASVGVDTTEEGGSDGFHYGVQPTMNMVAQIFYNLLCNE